MAKQPTTIMNYFGGTWQASTSEEQLDIVNPATAKRIGKVPLSSSEEVDLAVKEASAAYQVWKRVPPTERIQYLFRLKDLLETHFDEISCTITIENGKTF